MGDDKIISLDYLFFRLIGLILVISGTLSYIGAVDLPLTQNEFNSLIILVMGSTMISLAQSFNGDE